MKSYRFKLRLLPVIVFTAAIFLIVRAHSYNVDIGDVLNIPLDSSKELWDVFAYTKAQAVLLVTIWAGLTMAFLLITGQMQIKKTYIYIPMLIYVIAVLASYFLSDYKSIAWKGSPERFEGTRTLLCYIFMLFYTMNVVEELRDLVIIVLSTVAGVFAACLIGLSQLAGHDFFLTKLGNILVTGGSLSLEGEFLPGRVYQTVANMNYVGMYLALIIPILLYTLWYLIKVYNKEDLRVIGLDKKRALAIIAVLVILLLLIVINVYGAASAGGIIGVCASVGLMLIIMLKKKWQKIILGIAVFAGLSAALVFAYVQGRDTHRQIDYIETGRDSIRLSVNGNEISIIYDRLSDAFELRNAEGNYIDTYVQEWDEGVYQVDSPRFAGEIELIPFKDKAGDMCIIVSAIDDSFAFTFYEDGVKYMNPFGQEIPLGIIKSSGFDGHLSAGNGRGYIWSRTIPLLRDRILVGSGADTFMLVFPQEDYAGKYSSGAPLSITCDKAHNIFLCMAVGTGMISLIAFMAFVGMTMWKVLRLGNDKIYVKILAAGIMGFLIAGMFNDSSVCTMPMFYGLLGTVMAMIV